MFTFGAFEILVIVLVIALFGLWAYAIVDAARNGSIGWLLVVVGLGLPGALLYFLFADRSRTRLRPSS